MDDRNAPATKGDIADLSVDLRETREQLRSEMQETREQLRSEMQETREQLRSEMQETRDQLRSEMQHIYNDLVERMADGETRLLKGFYDFAQSNSKRVTELEGNEAAIRSRLGTLEERVLQIEKRLNMPPAA